MHRVILPLALLVIVAAMVWLSGAKPEIEIQPVRMIGTSTMVGVRVSDRNGIQHFRARLEQGSFSVVVLEFQRQNRTWKFRRPRRPLEQFQLTLGRKAIPQLQDGPARLVVEAKSDDLRGATVTQTMDLTVHTTPPRLSVDGAQHYINQGGSELVTFTTDRDVAEAGIRVGAYEFGSWPVPGGAPGARFCLFAFPHDVPATTAPVVYARDEAGNEQTAAFSFRLFPKKFRTREIELSDDFIRKVINNIGPHAPQLQLTGDLLGDFLKINRALREQNRRQLASMAVETAEAFLWTKPFRQLANSKVEAEFADHRRYSYQGKPVDEADHLGFDLAVTANVPVLAANDGRVIWADFLGIFGNCIVIDHGYGLQSIYGHLSSIGVKRGDSVTQGQEIGRSGSTGLAGGDHLHFSMQVQGMQVSPTEWWDPHWIHDRILAKFPGEKLPVGGPVKAAASAAP